jgi:formylglycine-generating enzyme required for sulfatase activity
MLTQRPEAEFALSRALERASAGVNNNADWQALYSGGFIHEYDGVDMALVPAGCFQMGDDPKGYHHDGDSWEQGVPDGGRVCFDEPFWMDRTEVTQGDFARFDGTQANENASRGYNHPVENITWAEARDFCLQRGTRLPTEAEWEYAARGVDALFYPWGNESVSENAVWNRDPSQGTAEVASIPAGASWVGAVDMSGNVWEWVNSLYRPYPYDATDGREAATGERIESPRGLRGSSWYGDESFLLRATLRGWSNPSIITGYWGFRCARSIE